MYDLTASIVIYNTKRDELKKAMKSFFNTNLNVKLYISDNSPKNDLELELPKILEECELKNKKIEYIFNNKNGGYGWGHNKIIKKLSLENKNTFENLQNNNLKQYISKYHLILNPDIYFNSGVLEKLFEYMEENKDVGQIMPMVKYPDGEIQYLCKERPKPINLIFRRFIPLKKIREKLDYKYEMRWSGYDKIMEVPILSGCFMFLRTENLVQLGGFDERYFMYMEDFDLSRRMNDMCKTIFYPYVEIVHNHAKESYKNRKMTIIHIKSAIKYFNKWGWF